MKQILLLMMLLLSSISYTQTDIEIKGAMLGTWSHVESTLPNDSTIVYWREKTFYNDSSLYSIGIIKGDTVTANAIWYVKGGSILIHSVYMFGGEEVIELIEYAKVLTITENEFYIRQQWGLENRRKTSHYLKKM